LEYLGYVLFVGTTEQLVVTHGMVVEMPDQVEAQLLGFGELGDGGVGQRLLFSGCVHHYNGYIDNS
jgi:hypothetical protein